MKISDINNKALEYLKKLPLKELRQRQDIINWQIKIAYKKKMFYELEVLQMALEQLDQAVYYIVFEKNEKKGVKNYA